MITDYNQVINYFVNGRTCHCILRLGLKNKNLMLTETISKLLRIIHKFFTYLLAFNIHVQQFLLYWAKLPV